MWKWQQQRNKNMANVHRQHYFNHTPLKCLTTVLPRSTMLPSRDKLVPRTQRIMIYELLILYEKLYYRDTYRMQRYMRYDAKALHTLLTYYQCVSRFNGWWGQLRSRSRIQFVGMLHRGLSIYTFSWLKYYLLFTSTSHYYLPSYDAETEDTALFSTSCFIDFAIIIW